MAVVVDTNHAERFMEMKDALDAILPSYERTVSRKQSSSSLPPARDGEPYLLTHLRHFVNSKTVGVCPRRAGGWHAVVACSTKDARFQLPRGVIAALQARPADAGTWDVKATQKVTMTWIVCYLEGILPDTSKPGWETAECSHRCISYGLKADKKECVEPSCLVWESKSANQSRGNAFCTRLCAHSTCGATVCVCQGLHTPPCL